MSVLDTRQLLFDNAALKAALRADNRVTRMLHLPRGAEDAIFLVPDDQSMEVMHTPQTLGGVGLPEIHRLTALQVAALLIAYCIRTGIPVPRNCKKTIMIHDEHVALNFTSRIAAAN